MLDFLYRINDKIRDFMKRVKLKFKNRLRLISQMNRAHGSNGGTLISLCDHTNDCVVASSRAIIYRSELNYLLNCISKYPNIETGGQLFGYWTDKGTPVVLYVIGPGPNANHQVAFFNQDLQYLETMGNDVLVRRYGLHHIGEWHSHHSLGLAHPSGHDANTVARGIYSSGVRHMLLCIGNIHNGMPAIKPFNFVAELGTKYISAEWFVQEQESPFRLMIDSQISNNKRPTEVYREQSLYQPEYWLNSKDNNVILKRFIDDLSKKLDVQNVEVKLDANRNVSVVYRKKGRVGQILFGNDFPKSPPCVFSDGVPIDICSQWKYNGNIYDSLKEYFNLVEI